MIWDNIPNELKENGLWCCWKLTDKGKIPIDAVTGKFAKSNDKTTFHSFQTALESVNKYYNFDDNGKQLGGLGLGIFNGFSAIDIDHCRTPQTGEMSAIAHDIIDYCASYTEISPSGTGIRIIFKTNTMIDKSIYYINNSSNGLEIYISENTNKFVTITGNVIYPSDLNNVDIQHILDKYMKKNNDVFSLDKVIKSDKKLNELWNSRASGSSGNESETDLALINKLAFYLKGDANAINTAFISSPYFASKDTTHKNKWLIRNDYREQTIQMALSSLNTGFISTTEFELNDTGNAHRFAEKFGEVIKYNVDNKCWMLWNGNYWQNDIYGNIKNYAEQVIDDMKQQMATVNDLKEKKALLDNIKRTLSSRGKTNMLKEVEHLSGIPCLNSDFDKNAFLFNCASGVIDLKTGQVTPHDKNLLLSKYSPFEIKNEQPTLWLKFLDEVFAGDKELINYVHKILGYSLTGSTREQCMFMFLGDGSNGKSVLLEIVNKVMGSYGATSDSGVLLERNNKKENLGDVARLNRIRNVVTNETNLGDKLNESSIKSLTSGIEPIVARFLYGSEFEFIPIFKIFMATNHKPIIRGTDNGIWRRIKIIPFNVTFDKDKQDKDLILKLTNEMPQILNWLVEGCLLWQKEGLGVPRAIENSVSEYRSEMDLVQRWVNECCIVGEEHSETSLALFNNLCNYTTANREFQMSNTLFGRNMSKKFQKKRYAGTTYYLGIGLRKDNDYILSKKQIDDI